MVRLEPQTIVGPQTAAAMLSLAINPPELTRVSNFPDSLAARLHDHYVCNGKQCSYQTAGHAHSDVCPL